MMLTNNNFQQQKFMARLLQSTHYKIEFVREIHGKKGTNRWLLSTYLQYVSVHIIIIIISYYLDSEKVALSAEHLCNFILHLNGENIEKSNKMK